MKIAHAVIISMVILFAIFAVHGYITYDLNLNELKNSIALKNEAQANSIMQNLDKYIKNRMDDVNAISKTDEIQKTIKKSNAEFGSRPATDSHPSKEIPFVSGSDVANLSNDFTNLADFYEQEYQYDISSNLYVTNQYGAMVTLRGDTSDALYSNEDWWQSAKNNGIFFGKIQPYNGSSMYYVPVALKVTDEDGDFIGVIKVSLGLDTILHDFEGDAMILKDASKNLMLLDGAGKVIYSDGIKYDPAKKPVSFYAQLKNDNGFLDTANYTQDPLLIAYSRSIGYGIFVGSDWSVLVEQNQSAISSELVNARNSILLISAIGIMGSIIAGVLVSVLVAKPLLRLSNMAKRISKGDFSVRAPRNTLYEIGVIGESFNNMTESLKKLVETEIKLAEAHVQIKNERLAAIGELAASLAHNLKNPLGTIRSSADIMRREYKGSDKEILDVISRMNRAVDRMTHQIDDVLNFVRITPLKLEETSLSSILNSVFKASSVPAGIKVELPEGDLKITCDIRKIEVVFANLVLNAVEAIGDKAGTITIRAEKKDGQIIIQVQDSGTGIPDDLIPRLFEPLTTSKLQGTGLGLSSCKNIIEQHGGTIEFRNNPTTFTIRIPQS